MQLIIKTYLMVLSRTVYTLILAGGLFSRGLEYENGMNEKRRGERVVYIRNLPTNYRQNLETKPPRYRRIRDGHRPSVGNPSLFKFWKQSGNPWAVNFGGIVYRRITDGIYYYFFHRLSVGKLKQNFLKKKFIWKL